MCGRRDLVGPAALQMLDLDDHFDLWDPPPELIDKVWDCAIVLGAGDAAIL